MDLCLHNPNPMRVDLVKIFEQSMLKTTDYNLCFTPPENPLVLQQDYIDAKDVLIQLHFFETSATSKGTDWERRTLLAHVFTPNDIMATTAFVLGKGPIPRAVFETGILQQTELSPMIGTAIQYTSWAHAVAGTLVLRHHWHYLTPPEHWDLTLLGVVHKRYPRYGDPGQYAAVDDIPQSSPMSPVSTALVMRAIKYHDIAVIRQLINQGHVRTLVETKDSTEVLASMGMGFAITCSGFVTRLLMYDEIMAAFGAGARQRLFAMGYGHFIHEFDAKSRF